MIVKFATLCDSCGLRSKEYESWPTCRACDKDICHRCGFDTDENEGRGETTCKLCYAQSHGIAWPGGYALLNLMKDGGILCSDCVNKDEVHLGDEDNPQWQFDSQFIHYEGSPLFCDNCGEEYPPEYGDPGDI